MWQKRPAVDDGSRKQLNGQGGWIDERRLSGQEEQNGNGWDGEQTETKWANNRTSKVLVYKPRLTTTKAREREESI